jgi:hypothetical protein
MATAPGSQGGHGGKLFSCFIDLKQAFDSVDREQLWRRLGDVGIGQGRFLTALKGLYAKTEFDIKVGKERSGSTLCTTQGVKQGCPLSPLLFGLLMDKLYARIQQDCPGVGVSLADRASTLLSHIMYADDVVLFACSELVCSDL